MPPKSIKKEKAPVAKATSGSSAKTPAAKMTPSSATVEAKVVNNSDTDEAYLTEALGGPVRVLVTVHTKTHSYVLFECDGNYYLAIQDDSSVDLNDMKVRDLKTTSEPAVCCYEDSVAVITPTHFYEFSGTNCVAAKRLPKKEGEVIANACSIVYIKGGVDVYPRQAPRYPTRILYLGNAEYNFSRPDVPDHPMVGQKYPAVHYDGEEPQYL